MRTFTAAERARALAATNRDWKPENWRPQRGTRIDPDTGGRVSRDVPPRVPASKPRSTDVLPLKREAKR